MEPEEKQLLLIDLCTRLPYGLIVEATYKDGEGWKTEDRKLKGIYEDGQVYVDCVYTNIENVRPYLRSMESMTDEESKEFALLQTDFYIDGFLYPIAATNMTDWLNAHHFDYRGLIPKGLALPAPEDMYK